VAPKQTILEQTKRNFVEVFLVVKKSELAIDKEKSGSHSIENQLFQYLYHFVSAYLCLQRLA
jgi:hypothetical protein